MRAPRQSDRPPDRPPAHNATHLPHNADSPPPPPYYKYPLPGVRARLHAPLVDSDDVWAVFFRVFAWSPVTHWRSLPPPRRAEALAPVMAPMFREPVPSWRDHAVTDAFLFPEDDDSDESDENDTVCESYPGASNRGRHRLVGTLSLLARCARVCSRWNRIVAPLIYRHVRLTAHARSVAFSRCIRSPMAMADHLTSLAVVGLRCCATDAPCSPCRTMLAAALTRLSALCRLLVHDSPSVLCDAAVAELPRWAAGEKAILPLHLADVELRASPDLSHAAVEILLRHLGSCRGSLSRLFLAALPRALNADLVARGRQTNWYGISAAVSHAGLAGDCSRHERSSSHALAASTVASLLVGPRPLFDLKRLATLCIAAVAVTKSSPGLDLPLLVSILQTAECIKTLELHAAQAWTPQDLYRSLADVSSVVCRPRMLVLGCDLTDDQIDSVLHLCAGAHGGGCLKDLRLPFSTRCYGGLPVLPVARLRAHAPALDVLAIDVIDPGESLDFSTARACLGLPALERRPPRSGGSSVRVDKFTGELKSCSSLTSDDNDTVLEMYPLAPLIVVRATRQFSMPYDKVLTQNSATLLNREVGDLSRILLIERDSIREW